MVTDKIPVITDPMGEYWRQPPVERVLLDDKNALMEQHTFDALSEYSCTLPTGTYSGKMWRRQSQGRWFLMWYGEIIGKEIEVHQREIIVA